MSAWIALRVADMSGQTFGSGGMGLVSGIYPVTEVKVAPGSRVRRGALLGRIFNPAVEGPVVTTWTLRMNGTYVDPARFSGSAMSPTQTED